MPIHLEIVTPDGVRFDDAVARVVIPGSEGDFGVLPGHERFLSPVRIGELDIEMPDHKHLFAAVSDGFVEVGSDHCRAENEGGVGPLVAALRDQLGLDAWLGQPTRRQACALGARDLAPHELARTVRSDLADAGR